MADVFVMPRLGQSMEEGTILQWFKQEGDSVRKGEPLLEVMSDKANFEVPAESDGVLRRVLAAANDTVPVNAPIAILGTADEPIEGIAVGESERPGNEETRRQGDKETAAGGAQSAIRSPQSAIPAVSPRARRLADERGVPVAALAGIGTGPGGRVIERDVMAYIGRQANPAPTNGGAAPPAPPSGREPGPAARVTPLAARVADDLGVDVGDLALGLPGSRIRAEDVRRHAESTATPPIIGGPGGQIENPAVAGVIPFRGLRKLVAENVARSRQTAPHVTLTLEVDMGEAAAALARLRPEVQRAYGTKLTYTDLLIKAAARALVDHPLCNAALVEDEIRVYADRNIGVAVATDTSLIVPVIHGADRKTLGEVSAELKALVERCRGGRQAQEDLAGGTFTITNLGAFGIDVFDPIIVPPQSCILGVGRVAEKAVVGGGQVVARPMMNLCLSFDHRVLDGAPAARFLQRMKELLETPLLIFA